MIAMFMEPRVAAFWALLKSRLHCLLPVSNLLISIFYWIPKKVPKDESSIMMVCFGRDSR